MVSKVLNKDSQRLGYMDALRGFAMFCVVFRHSGQGCYIGTYESGLFSIIYTFFLPLFFLISGFFAYKSNDRWNLSMLPDWSISKIQALLICPLVFYEIYAFAFHHTQFAWTTNGFGLYWFTIVLAECFIIYLISIGLGKLFRCNALTYIFMIIFSIVALGILVLRIGNSSICTVLNIDDLSKYLQFFTLGLLIKKYWHRCHAIFTTSWFKSFCIIAYMFLLFFYFSDTFKDNHPIAFAAIHDVIIRYVGVLLVVVFFLSYENFFNSENIVARMLRLIGKRSLEIYMIHYFFLPKIPQLRDFFLDSHEVLLLIGYCFFVSLGAIAMSFLISNILRMSPFIMEWLFGMKKISR